MTDVTFDLFALHQWETDGGPAFDDADNSQQEDLPTAPAQLFREFASAAVAVANVSCLPFRAAKNSDLKETT